MILKLSRSRYIIIIIIITIIVVRVDRSVYFCRTMRFYLTQ